ncbi:MAG: hypothetical protein ABUL44_03055 [Flavobacterium sp.]
MNELVKTGKRRTILISISILLVSIHTIYFYHAVRSEIESNKLTQQVIRFLLTIGLLVLTYKGKKWARITSVVLFSLAILMAVSALATLEGPFVNRIPLMVMVFVYSTAVWHFGFSDSYKAFLEYQNGEKTELQTDGNESV